MGYPDTEGFAYSFSRTELSIGNKIYVAVVNVEGDQPTEEGVVKGTRPYPLATTEGTMDPGEGSITFSDEAERQRFLDDMGDAWREKRFVMTWTRTSRGKPAIKTVYYGCRILSEPEADEEGPDPLGGDVTFSFLYRTRNGKAPHSGLPTPTAT